MSTSHEPARRRIRPGDLPTGTLTFLFTDIESSTVLLQELGGQFLSARDQHDGVIRAAIAEGGARRRSAPAA